MSTPRGLLCLSLVISFLGFNFAQSAYADSVFNLGGSFTLTGTNAPDDYSESVTLNPGTTTVDGGTVTLTQSILASAGGGEWVIFDFRTANGGVFANNPNSDWELLLQNIPLQQPSEVLQIYLDWGTNGTLAGPTNNTNSNLSLETNKLRNFGGATHGGSGRRIRTASAKDSTSGAVRLSRCSFDLLRGRTRSLDLALSPASLSALTS
jgi:hypothetical protein